MMRADAPAIQLARSDESARLLARRLAMAALVIATMAGLVWWFAHLLASDGMTWIDLAITVCFAATLPWYAIGFWNSLIGFGLLAFAKDAAKAVFPGLRTVDHGMPIRSRTAIVMPVYNENPERVFRHIDAIAQSLVATREAAAFEIFVLSDTQKPEIAAREERLFAPLRARHDGAIAISYRRRADNSRFKTGNLWEWLEAHGSRFEHFLVLDADSLMEGEAILRLVRIMEQRPEVGILQPLIVGLPNRSAFARIFQFGMRHGLRAYTAGSAWWQGDCGSYWGHNGLIRTRAFIEHCRLPRLPGKPPFGGWIMSHDQVEAQFMRKAGYEVRVIPEEYGSYEENPPALPEFLRRDLRWGQGNWQYIKLLNWPGMHPMGRLALALAIQMYITGPMWVMAALLSLVGAILYGALPVLSIPVLAPVPNETQAAGAYAFLALMLAMTIAPKIFGIAQVLVSASLRRASGGGAAVIVSAVIEYLFSLLLAPIMAVAEALMLVRLLLGRTILWDAQMRDNHTVPLKDALRGLAAHLILGLVYLATVLMVAPDDWLLGLLFAAPLLLAVPFTCLSARTGLGDWLARRKICCVPEEIEPPPVVVAAGHAIPRPRPDSGFTGGPAGAPALEVPAAAPVD